MGRNGHPGIAPTGLSGTTLGGMLGDVGSFGFFKTIVILAVVAGLAWFALDWARRDRQADFDRINPPITVQQPNPIGT